MPKEKKKKVEEVVETAQVQAMTMEVPVEEPVDKFATEPCPTCAGAAVVSVCNKIDDVVENYKRYHIYYCKSCKNTFRMME